ncbi:hypothetical protein B0I08_1201 [Glaciihabitans tibetensis]|uniref:Transposase n=1 Tax=Glaciihabitans tibetensis TaxID=1266600 RepID=A0A2T0UZA3_9MICO|nr:hypothetical protein [Glaciihabitans tibetensis]PRY63168.1 hypothetical protein B0I08_1201 [Glaciihabitans tibetensis]
MVNSTRAGTHKPLAVKLQIVAEYEAAPHGEKGAVARAHNVQTRMIHRWAYARDNDEFGFNRSGRRTGGTMTPKKQSSEIVRLRKQLARAQAETEIARANQHVLKAAMESLGKAHALLEELSESADSDQKPAESKKPPSWPSSPMD